ncbi:uncharacterized protein C8P63_12711 [Melghirimyces profundicolus]|uniref:DUF418 domain-containing protein n=1 Tax=Melghirimyces profundicolus TaxID=1242148 RepID=A0A2T6BC80_9BACL|nr:DUF418 domain-containing protein [Melghirimyces profundicolus]PTX53691.1 uncharacterized protein C8P63_12711 [Melghirimyces profundicolus]
MEPTAERERLEVIDILRGFAVFGILLVNMADFKSAELYRIRVPGEGWDHPDGWVQHLIRILAQGHFYTLFSFLFGFGMIFMMERARERGKRFVPAYVRRLLTLMLLGLVHAWLIWFGDILFSYAVLGFILLLFHRAGPKTLLAAGLLILLIHTAVNGWLYSGPAPTPEQKEAIAASHRWWEEHSTVVYKSGTFGEVTEQRIHDWTYLNSHWYSLWPPLLAMFLLGAAAAKRRVFHRLDSSGELLRKGWRWSLGVALVLGVLEYVVSPVIHPDPYGFRLLVWIGNNIGDPAACLFYLTSVALLYRKWGNRLRPLAPVGRMALTNYLLQSLFFTTLFYSYGLGWYGEVEAVAGLILTVVFFFLQIFFSRWWMGRFHQGPVEWILRTATYGRPVSFRRGN